MVGYKRVFLIGLGVVVGLAGCSEDKGNPPTDGGVTDSTVRRDADAGDGAAPQACSIDALGIGTVGSKKVMQIMKNGKYWTLDMADSYKFINPAGATGDALSANAQYLAGPCQGHPNDCQIDDIAFGSIKGTELVQVMAYGKYWTMKTSDFSFTNPSGAAGDLLGENTQYKAGPCQGHTTDCKIDGLAIASLNGTEMIQVAAYGKYWTMKTSDFSFINPGKEAGDVLGENAQYKAGPCQGHTSDCQIDAHAFGLEGTKEIVQVVAYGKYWTMDVAQGYKFTNPSGANGDVLQSNPQLASGPCAGI